MAKTHTIRVKGNSFTARTGELVLDAALMAGIDIPFDCRAGRCGTCITRCMKGRTIGGETHQRDMVHACQARVLSDLELQFEKLPPAGFVDGRLKRVTELAGDVMELEILPDERLTFLPGQYYRFKFRGFPARCYSPTLPLDRPLRSRRIHLNVKRVRDGRVSMSLGKAVRAGHRVRMEGPFGTAFFRRRQRGRLVLVAGGTGFAPIWSVANAALEEDPCRPLVLIAGARAVPSLYMAPALERIARLPNVRVIPTTEESHPACPMVPVGKPSDHLPPLSHDDIVYAAGAPAMVSAVTQAASEAGARVFSDPFEASANSRARSWFAWIAS